MTAPLATVTLEWPVRDLVELAQQISNAVKVCPGCQRARKIWVDAHLVQPDDRKLDAAFPTFAETLLRFCAQCPTDAPQYADFIATFRNTHPLSPLAPLLITVEGTGRGDETPLQRKQLEQRKLDGLAGRVYALLYLNTGASSNLPGGRDLIWRHERSLYEKVSQIAVTPSPEWIMRQRVSLLFLHFTRRKCERLIPSAPANLTVADLTQSPSLNLNYKQICPRLSWAFRPTFGGWGKVSETDLLLVFDTGPQKLYYRANLSDETAPLCSQAVFKLCQDFKAAFIRKEITLDELHTLIQSLKTYLIPSEKYPLPLITTETNVYLVSLFIDCAQLGPTPHPAARPMVEELLASHLLHGWPATVEHLQKMVAL